QLLDRQPPGRRPLEKRHPSRSAPCRSTDVAQSTHLYPPPCVPRAIRLATGLAVFTAERSRPDDKSVVFDAMAGKPREDFGAICVQIMGFCQGAGAPWGHCEQPGISLR